MIKNTIKLALTSLAFVTVCSADYGTVNGEKITKDEVMQVMGPQGIEFDTLDKGMKDRVVGMIVDRKLLSQEAGKAGLDTTDSYKTKLELLKKDLILTVWMEQEAKKIEDSTKESDLKAFYDKNSDKFKTPAELKASHILVEKEDNATAIIKILNDSNDTKAEFIKLAKEKSTGPSGKSGGDLGWFSLDKMVPEFSAAADKLKKGNFTKEPVKTQFGFHIIYLDDRKDAGVQKFDDVKEQIKGNLNKEKFNKLIESTIEKLKKDAKIELK
ncbi:peptidylprolyl isomerase [Sulfurovum sp. bin170]|uniref:peptidylprolyl isomerase n=1 Tax=Sulfurovum sp. bin170 TaxID=2695268 RepID=UPI0013DF9ACF|nr:peptidylprolyl isomerase [Sulfurovum sp. bin170]NEW59941.1 peptidylprolyl isomerase [Sulfurovum sp. bin170]